MSIVNVNVKFTPKQEAALTMMKGGFLHTLGYGGSRSGKTFFFVFSIFTRAILYAGSRHLIARLHANHAKVSLWLDTMRKVESYFPGLKLDWNETDRVVRFPNGSEIWVDGLDDRERVDKILGREYATIYFNEVSQLGYGTVQTVLTRLAQLIPNCKPKAFYDLNPTSKGHWSYQLFMLLLDPITEFPLQNPGDYHFFQLNPHDNEINISSGYIETILAHMSESKKQRFLLGEYADDSDLVVYRPRKECLYDEEMLATWMGEVGKGNIRITAGLDVGFEDADGFVIIAYSVIDNKRWLIWEHKARREGIMDLSVAVKHGLDYINGLGLPSGDIQIYSDTGGGGKKIVYDLFTVYGLPCVSAYKQDKKAGIELLQDDIRAGRFYIPKGGGFARECERIMWKMGEDDDSVIREIDDASYHPDLMDAILYAMRYLWLYSNNL